MCGETGPVARLTKRQAEIARWLACGASRGEIARRLGISRRTVEGHIESIHRTLGTQSQAQIVGVVIVCGLVPIALVRAELAMRTGRCRAAEVE